MKYFAYGLNTNLASMAARCPAAQPLGPAEIPNHRFMFSGCATVEPCKDETVHGVLWEITEECLVSLDMLEGYPHFYDRKLVTVVHNGRKEKALVYYMVGDISYSPPFKSYFNSCLEGYIENNVDERQLYSAILERVV